MDSALVSIMASTYRSLSRHAFSSPVICALNKPSTPSPNYDKDNEHGSIFNQVRKVPQGRETTSPIYQGKTGIPAYEAEMELVLLLIFQGRYQEALKCTCLDDQSPQGFGINSDGRVHLYKAIIYTMLDRDKEAKKCWKSFIRGFSSPINQIPPEQFK
ncbi:hypothetical protein M0R45_037175 [Rubus argutus]|uniref:Uncharacterized protein n=1 Tax=Rubus argutus TaxID=59490 RepID=A0AAW1W2P3_RUBAR